MTGLTPVSFVLGDDLVTVPSSFLPGSWRSASNSLLYLSACLWSWSSFTKRSSSLKYQCKLCNLGLESIDLQTLCNICQEFCTMRTSETGPMMDKTFGSSWQCLGFGTRSRTRIFSTHRSFLILIRHLHLVEFYKNSRGSQDVWRRLLFQNLEAQSPCILFPGAWVVRDTKKSTSSGSTKVTILLSTRTATRPFSCSVKRIGNTNSQLPRRHWADSQRIWFWTGVRNSQLSFKELFGTRVSTTQSTGTFEDMMTSLFESLYHLVGGAILFDRGNRHSTSILNPETSNVLVRTSWRHSWLLRHSKYNYHHSFSIQRHWTLTWRWSGPRSLLALCSLSPSRSGSREEEIMTKILGNFSTRIQSVLRRVPLRLGSTNTSWDLQLDLSILLLLLKYLSPVRHKERHQGRHIFLPSPTWPLDHWPILISSMMVTNIPSIPHSELSTSESCWIHSKFTRILCSCSFPNLSGNPVRGGWLLSSTKLKTIPMSIHWSCMNPLRMLDWLQTFPTCFPNFEISSPCIDGLCIPCSWTLVSMQQVSLCLDPFVQVSWWRGDSSLVDSLEKIRLPISNYLAPNFLVPSQFFFFHRHSPDWLQIPNLMPCTGLSSFRHGTNHNVLSILGEKTFEMSTRIHREIHKIEQTQQVIPFIFRETLFGQYVRKLVFGVNIFDLDFGFQIDSVN